MVQSAASASQIFGPFMVSDGPESAIVLNGEIDLSAALNFRRALSAAPGARVLVLNSPGGLVQTGLLIADDVHERGIATYIPADARCYSACAFIFLAGRERRADGALGVHQISASTPDLEGAQVAISDIIELLSRFGTPPEVLTAMFRTSADDMHVFSPDEVDRFINRGTVGAVAELPERTGQDVGGSLPSAGVLPQGSLGDLAELVKQPARLAMYSGLDFFGADIAVETTPDVGACAVRCLERNGECQAFTFNVSPEARQGPNCFLKAERGQLDGNSVALSGLVLARGQGAPEAFRVGVIDPKEGTFNDVDLPGGDLSSLPHPAADTPLACRLACVQNEACGAYTFVRAKKQCWLKRQPGTPRFARDMLSGLKTVLSFEPARVIALD
ncbi:PAN domain-containing protein [Aquibium sp. ELW1220]|uniref:PAN domain-containing protein n=1 Tax=Aquibium sp. ELW1220 TaxID=2976766 RepID=UPI0025B23119|nr:PAN domain-containing protein [Aquibium sp. ELW1220]MDN2580876.1 PAN domain-containing protein [Aquibium sp. ELW1220]